MFLILTGGGAQASRGGAGEEYGGDAAEAPGVQGEDEERAGVRGHAGGGAAARAPATRRVPL